MNAFKAYKACVPIAWSPNLYITLVRGIPGTRRLHRRTLEALRLGKCNRTVMRWNTPTVRGMLQQVKRLVVVETEEMFKARKEKEANQRALRHPLAELEELEGAELEEQLLQPATTAPAAPVQVPSGQRPVRPAPKRTSGEDELAALQAEMAL